MSSITLSVSEKIKLTARNRYNESTPLARMHFPCETNTFDWDDNARIRPRLARALLFDPENEASYRGNYQVAVKVQRNCDL